MKKIMLGVLALSSLFFFGCGKSDDLTGVWKTQELTASETLPLCESYIEFKLENGHYEIHGNSGVNLFSGSVEAKKGVFKPSDKLASTKMMGDPASVLFEDEFLKILTTADVYEINGDELVIKNSENNYRLVLKK